MEIESKLREFICKNFYVADPDQLGADVSLLDAGIIDSTGVLELIAYLEDTFHLSVAEDDMTPANFDSIEKIATYVRGSLSPGGFLPLDCASA